VSLTGTKRSTAGKPVYKYSKCQHWFSPQCTAKQRISAPSSALPWWISRTSFGATLHEIWEPCFCHSWYPLPISGSPVRRMPPDENRRFV